MLYLGKNKKKEPGSSTDPASGEQHQVKDEAVAKQQTETVEESSKPEAEQQETQKEVSQCTFTLIKFCRVNCASCKQIYHKLVAHAESELGGGGGHEFPLLFCLYHYSVSLNFLFETDWKNFFPL